MMGQEQSNIKGKKWEQLREQERYKIEALLKAKKRPKEIAEQLKRDRRTIEREIERGSVIQRRENPYVSRNPKVPEYIDEMVYCADVGQRKHEEKAANKGRGLKIGHDHALVTYLEEKIGKERYSPDAAIGEIKAKGLKFSVSICTKTVYNYLDKEIFLGISNKDLPIKRDGKKRKYRKTRKIALNNIKGRSIEERPEAVEDRAEYGHWEMDCVVGKGRACLLVLTERKSRQQLIFRMPSKTQRCVHDVMDRLERHHKGKFKRIFQSITMDNGCEFLDMNGLEESILRLGTKRTTCYYAHPYSAWERGSNENANRLIRRFIPKGADIGKYTLAEIKRIEHWMNHYPRRMFGYKTANDMVA